jgi:zinc transport system substrate-binding protein
MRIICIYIIGGIDLKIIKILKSTSIAITVILTISLFFTACHVERSDAGSGLDKETVIVASFYPMYILTKNIVKDVPNIKLVNMSESHTGCLHDYQLSTRDLKILESADIFIYNGAGMENFLDKVISQVPDLVLIEASKNIPLLKDEKGEDNPHIWVSISGAVMEVQNIAEGLVGANPENEELYRQNSREYIKKLGALKSKMKEELKDLKIRDIITFHEAFPYFAQEFGLRIAAVIVNKPGTVPSAGELANTMEIIRKNNIKVLFIEPQYSGKAANTISSETGAKIFTLDPIVTGPSDASPDSYERAMEENLKVLVEALK